MNKFLLLCRELPKCKQFTFTYLNNRVTMSYTSWMALTYVEQLAFHSTTKHLTLRIVK